MSDEKQPQNPQTGQAYTGKTIVMPRQKPPEQKPPEPEPREKPASSRRTYRNPPPSQRKSQSAREQTSAPARPAVSRRNEAQPGHQHAGQARAAEPRQQQRQVIASSLRPRRSLWKKVRRVVLMVAVLALVVLVGGGGFLYSQARSAAAAVVVPDVRSNPPLHSPMLEATNVLLVGVDERPDHPEEGVRSDTLILARINTYGRWVNLLSIPRDTQVDIAGIGTTKINVAYGQGYERAEELYGAGTTPQQGGMALAAQTVEDFLNLRGYGTRIHYTAQINFDGFVGIIDALGGITINVPTHIVDYAYPTPDFGTRVVEFHPGEQHMNGETALIYARTRHADSDFGRSERQQQVMRAIVAELQAKGWAGRVAALPALLDSLEGQEGGAQPVLTTMPFARPDVLLGLTIVASGISPDAIGRLQISPDTVVLLQEVGSNLVWDEQSVGGMVEEWLRPPETPEPAP
jgi:LCP family protein required for cell wall assembly